MQRSGFGAALAAIGLLLFLAPDVALAERIEHRGALIGVPDSRVAFTLKQDRDESRRIAGMAFGDVPYTCDGGASGTISAELPSFPVRGRDFTRRGEIEGEGIRKGAVRVAGRFSSRSRRARGRVRFSFRRAGGARCDTGQARWRTRER